MFKQPYTAEQIDFIQLNCSKMTAAELVVLFNQTFNDNRTKKGLQYFMQSRGWTTIKRPNTWADGFTAEQKDFMRQYAPEMSRKELAEFFNAFFGTAICLNTIKGWCARHKLPSPNGNGRFTSENHPRWQEGLSSEEIKAHFSEESFAKLLTPMLEANKKHKIGDEIIRHGVPYIVINEEYGHGIDHRIKLKSHYIWEQQYGEVPSDHMMIHLDNDPMNCEISNLRCIPKKYRSFLRHHDWWNAPAEVKDTALKWCELYYALKGV
jgi:hypothetical protein